MNTNQMTRAKMPTAKNAPDRAYNNGTVTGMNVSRREEQDRLDNEAFLRGYAKFVFNEIKQRNEKIGIDLPDELIIRVMKKRNIRGAYLL